MFSYFRCFFRKSDIFWHRSFACACARVQLPPNFYHYEVFGKLDPCPVTNRSEYYDGGGGAISFMEAELLMLKVKIDTNSFSKRWMPCQFLRFDYGKALRFLRIYPLETNWILRHFFSSLLTLGCTFYLIWFILFFLDQGLLRFRRSFLVFLI